jgi:serine O-acetyltransferase
MEIVPTGITGGENAVAIVGWEEGGAGQIASWLEKASSHRIACFVHPGDEAMRIDIPAEAAKRDSRLFEFPLPDSFRGRPMITSTRWTAILKELGVRKILVTLGDNRERLRQLESARLSGLELINAIHPTALILEEARLHENIMIHSRGVIGYRAEVHDGVIVNTGAQLDHHNVIRSCARIDPGVVTAGNVTIGECATLHTGAVVKNRIRIGCDAIVGAGAVVIRDVPENETVVGVPAEPIRRRRT